MRVYVASKFCRLLDVRRIVEKLRGAGLEVHADWTTHSAAGDSGLRLHRKLTAYANHDYLGVHDCDTLLMLHDPDSRGGFAELGMALAWHKLVLVVGGRLSYPDRGPIFYAMPEVHHFEDEDSAVAWLRRLEIAYATRTREEETKERT